MISATIYSIFQFECVYINLPLNLPMSGHRPKFSLLDFRPSNIKNHKSLSFFQLYLTPNLSELIDYPHHTIKKIKSTKNKKVFIEPLEQRIMLDGAGSSTFLDLIDERSQVDNLNKSFHEVKKFKELKKIGPEKILIRL